MIIDDLPVELAKRYPKLIDDLRSIAGYSFFSSAWLLREIYLGEIKKIPEKRLIIEKSAFDVIENILKILNEFIYAARIYIEKTTTDDLIKELETELSTLKTTLNKEEKDKLIFFDNLITYLDQSNIKFKKNIIDTNDIFALINKNNRSLAILTELEILEVDLD